MYRIAKFFRFSASHTLDLPATHRCSRLHGHNYLVEVVLESESLDIHGFVEDYGSLAVLKEHLDGTFDHRHLNDVMPEQPTAENLARKIFDFCREQWPQTSAVKVSETPDTWAEYSSTAAPDDEGGRRWMG